MEAVSPRPRKLSRLYSTEPRGLIMFFWMTLKIRRQADCRNARQSHDARWRGYRSAAWIQIRNRKLRELRFASWTFTSTSS